MKAEPSWFLIWLLRRPARNSGKDNKMLRESPLQVSGASVQPTLLKASISFLFPQTSITTFSPQAVHDWVLNTSVCCWWNVFAYRSSLNQRILILIPPQKMSSPQTESTSEKWDRPAGYRIGHVLCKTQEKTLRSKNPSSPFSLQTILLLRQPCFRTFIPKSGLPSKHRA